MKDLTIQELIDETTLAFNHASRIANENNDPKRFDIIATAKRQIRSILTDEIILEYLKSEKEYREHLESGVKK